MPSKPPPKRRYTSVWERDAARAAEEESRAGQPSGTNREQIVRAAVEILDTEGLDALTMRRLGTKLGMGATSLYWYVANKNELLDLALDEVYGEMEVPAEGAWTLVASVFAHSMRQALLRHPWAVRLIGTRPSLGPHALDTAERTTGLLLDAGFPAQDADFAITTLIAYVLGICNAEVGWRETLTATGLSHAEWLEARKPVLKAVIGDRPRLRSVIDAHEKSPGSRDPRFAVALCFDFGLKSVLDGLAARLSVNHHKTPNKA